MSTSIYLGDLGYYNDYNYSQPTPLNVAYIGSYLKTQIPEQKVEIFKNPIELLERIKEAPPFLIGLSHYQWNSNLNLKVIEEAKRANPNIVSVLGGPQFDGTNQDWIKSFFCARPQIDFHIEREGEATFSELVENLLDSSVDAYKREVSRWPATLFSYDYESGSVLSNPVGPFERMDLSNVPSPYLDGSMDKFFDDKFLAPIIETNRGCPYSCSFCAWGSATQSKVRQFPVDVVLDEIKYVAKRSKNPQKLLYLADANFGMLKRDEEIATAIADSSFNQEFPNQTYVYFAKNTNDRVVKVAELMKTVTSMSMSKQSVNDNVLANIKRKNIPHEQYDKLALECEKRGITTFSELIYGLPGETYDSFVKGVIRTVRQKAKVAIYPMLLIEGAENHTQEHRDEFGIKTKYRVIPRYISTMPGLRTLEYEEVAIENDALPFEDWLKIREFHFLIILLASEVFSDLKMELEAFELDYATLATRILDDKPEWPKSWSAFFDSFRSSTVDELMDRNQLRVEFELNEMEDIELKYPAQNYYYYAMLVCNSKTINDFQRYLINGVQRFFPEVTRQISDKISTAISLCFDRIICYEDLKPKKRIKYNYDLDAWVRDPKRTSLAKYSFNQEQEFELLADETLRPRIDELMSNGLSLVDAVYKLRNGYIGYRGDIVFSYSRTQVQSASKCDS